MFRTNGKIENEKQKSLAYSRFSHRLYVEMFKTFIGKKENILSEKILKEVQIGTKNKEESEKIKKLLRDKYKGKVVFGYEDNQKRYLIFFLKEECNINNLKKEIKNLEITLKKYY
ncbi:hypothetical protein KIN38_17185 [Vibrio sp. B511a]|uniref:hypothetical protein n=1 Tax=Vibrio sp. B511a TaxID=2835905 RepID=UPI002555F816|nr:hypothetical protein [Vibrio sp. B511a]MDK9734463.1 hypothetical protein [Vibrio sp. B511a]